MLISVNRQTLVGLRIKERGGIVPSTTLNL